MGVDELVRSCHGPGDSLPLAWLLREGLGVAKLAGGELVVDYQAFLSRFEVRWSAFGVRGLGQCRMQLREALHKLLLAALSWDEIRCLFDRDLDGFVSQDECRLILRQIITGLSERQAHLVAEILRPAFGGGSVVPVRRFLVAIEFEFASLSLPEDPFLREALPAIAGAVCTLEPRGADASSWLRAGENLLDLFLEWDVDGNGFVSREELLQQLGHVGILAKLGFDAYREDMLIRHLNPTETGDINAFEFLRGFALSLPGARTERSSASRQFENDMLANFCALILSEKPVVLRACRALDVLGSGALPRDAFLSIVRVLLEVLPQRDKCWSFEGRLLELSDALDDMVVYDEVLGALQIVDTLKRDF